MCRICCFACSINRMNYFKYTSRFIYCLLKIFARTNQFRITSNHFACCENSLKLAFIEKLKFCFQGATALTVWLLACIMFVFSAVMAYTFILSKNIIRFIKIRYNGKIQLKVQLDRVIDTMQVRKRCAVICPMLFHYLSKDLGV